MSGATNGAVKNILRVEGLCVVIAAVLAYSKYGLGWKIFAYFFLGPDISLAAYFAGPLVGAVAYNAVHSYVGALACLCIGASCSNLILVAAGLIWCAHIGFDRVLGYGLKYPAGFWFTHLGRVGGAKATT